MIVLRAGAGAALCGTRDGGAVVLTARFRGNTDQFASTWDIYGHEKATGTAGRRPTRKFDRIGTIAATIGLHADWKLLQLLAAQQAS